MGLGLELGQPSSSAGGVSSGARTSRAGGSRGVEALKGPNHVGFTGIVLGNVRGHFLEAAGCRFSLAYRAPDFGGGHVAVVARGGREMVSDRGFEGASHDDTSAGHFVSHWFNRLAWVALYHGGLLGVTGMV